MIKVNNYCYNGLSPQTAFYILVFWNTDVLSGWQFDISSHFYMIKYAYFLGLNNIIYEVLRFLYLLIYSFRIPVSHFVTNNLISGWYPRVTTLENLPLLVNFPKVAILPLKNSIFLVLMPFWGQSKRLRNEILWIKSLTSIGCLKNSFVHHLLHGYNFNCNRVRITLTKTCIVYFNCLDFETTLILQWFAYWAQLSPEKFPMQSWCWKM